MANLFTSESKFLEQARTALTNAQGDEAIKAALNEYTMTDERLAEGEAIYTLARNTWEANKKEDAETKEASNEYRRLYDQLQAKFKTHRDKVNIFFDREPEVLIQLGTKGRFPTRYNVFFDKVKLFYGTLKNNAALLEKTSILQINEEEVTIALSALEELKSKRSIYEKEKAESQDMTQTKNEALLTLKDWMDEFYTIAKVAFYNKPQMLEALGGFVRS